jgi:hypothetical protein
MDNSKLIFLKIKGLAQAQGEERTSSENKALAPAHREGNLSLAKPAQGVPSCQIKLFRFYSPPGHGQEVGLGRCLIDEPASPQRLVEDIKNARTSQS